MEGAGPRSGAGGVVGDSGLVCRAGRDRDVIYEGERVDGVGEAERGEGEGEGRGEMMEADKTPIIGMPGPRAFF